MDIKILSYARKTGTFKGISYDKVIIYGCSMLSTYENDNTCLTGYPIEFHSFGIPVSKFSTVCNVSITELDSVIGKHASVSYGVRTISGREVCYIDKFNVET